MKRELERRIRALEEALDCFSGMEWIIKVGETAALKSVVLEEGMEAHVRAAPPDHVLEELDRRIAAARGAGPLSLRRAAFLAAQALLREWLAPADGRHEGRAVTFDFMKQGPASAGPVSSCK